MQKMRLKGCPKCQGDVFIGYDLMEGWTEKCIQCGFRRYLQNLAGVQRETGKPEAETNGQELCSSSNSN